MTAVPHGLAPVVPGSSVKGVLRDTAERIVRTVLGDDGPAPATTSSASAIAQRSVPLVDVVFGSASDDRDVDSSAGLLGVDDCVATGPVVAVDDWAKVLTLTKPGAGRPGSDVRAVLDAVPVQQDRSVSVASLRSWEWRHHVAVDRWSGAAAEGHLFTELEPWGVDWPPLRVTLRRGHLDPLDTPTWLAAVTLVGLVLEEMAQGRLRLGHGGGRGLGEVRLTSLEPRHAPAGTAPPEAAVPVLDRLAQLAGTTRAELADAWSDWVDQQRQSPPSHDAQMDQEEAR
jgi:CRISPR/Cas system CSM-associated protein Csm3 (group 7 of RAMP superfamily)